MVASLSQAGRKALGFLFNALSYRWLAKGQPDPEGFTLERVANFLYSFLGRPHPKKKGSEGTEDLYLLRTPLNRELFAPLGLTHAIDCALFWDFGVLWQKKLVDADGTQVDDRSEEQKAQFSSGLKVCAPPLFL